MAGAMMTRWRSLADRRTPAARPSSMATTWKRQAGPPPSCRRSRSAAPSPSGRRPPRRSASTSKAGRRSSSTTPATPPAARSRRSRSARKRRQRRATHVGSRECREPGPLRTRGRRLRRHRPKPRRPRASPVPTGGHGFCLRLPRRGRRGAAFRPPLAVGRRRLLRDRVRRRPRDRVDARGPALIVPITKRRSAIAAAFLVLVACGGSDAPSEPAPPRRSNITALSLSAWGAAWP